MNLKTSLVLNLSLILLSCISFAASDISLINLNSNVLLFPEGKQSGSQPIHGMVIDQSQFPLPSITVRTADQKSQTLRKAPWKNEDTFGGFEIYQDHGCEINVCIGDTRHLVLDYYGKIDNAVKVEIVGYRLSYYPEYLRNPLHPTWLVVKKRLYPQFLGRIIESSGDFKMGEFVRGIATINSSPGYCKDEYCIGQSVYLEINSSKIGDPTKLENLRVARGTIVAMNYTMWYGNIDQGLIIKDVNGHFITANNSSNMMTTNLPRSSCREGTCPGQRVYVGLPEDVVGLGDYLGGEKENAIVNLVSPVRKLLIVGKDDIGKQSGCSSVGDINKCVGDQVLDAKLKSVVTIQSILGGDLVVGYDDKHILTTIRKFPDVYNLKGCSTGGNCVGKPITANRDIVGLFGIESVHSDEIRGTIVGVSGWSLAIENNGAISFYNETGTTPKGEAILYKLDAQL